MAEFLQACYDYIGTIIVLAIILYALIHAVGDKLQVAVYQAQREVA